MTQMTSIRVPIETRERIRELGYGSIKAGLGRIIEIAAREHVAERPVLEKHREWLRVLGATILSASRQSNPTTNPLEGLRDALDDNLVTTEAKTGGGGKGLFFEQEDD